MHDGLERLGRHIIKSALCGLLVVLGTACSGEDRPKGIVTASGGSGATGGSGGSGGQGADAGSGGSIPGAPLVTITAPSEVLDPNQDGVIVADTVDVVCTAVKSTRSGAADVEPASVKLELLDVDKAVVSEAPGTPTGADDEYSASFVLTTVPNGPVSFRCTAADTSTPAKPGSDDLQTFVDHGPAIKITSPAPDSAYPLAGAVPFSFEVLPEPLDDTDQKAGVSSVDLSVNGVDITPTVDPANPNGYKLSVDFNDTTLFPQAPSGDVAVEIIATNARTPEPATRLSTYHFALDGTGPAITIKSHKDQQIIGGKVTLVFDVTDAISAVDPKTVAVELNQIEYLNGNGQWAVNGNEYSFTFDSANVSGSQVQITVNISASDVAGNESPGASLILYLDNYAPTIDMNPYNVRVRRKSGTGIQCSESFDPLGISTGDGDQIQSFAMFRALVWDQTNFVAGQSVLYLSGVDQSSVFLYLQPDSAIPLLLNNDGDPQCDVLSTAPGGKSLPSLQLKPITPQGQAWFRTDDPNADPDIDASCTQGTDTNPPLKLCNEASDLSHVIRHNAFDVEPVVYGIGALTGLECTGSGWEVSSQLANSTKKEGWFCLAVAAKDKVGNASVSRPLRVCYDNPAVAGQPACAISSEPPPSCTDGCTPPPSFGPAILALH